MQKEKKADIALWWVIISGEIIILHFIFTDLFFEDDVIFLRSSKFPYVWRIGFVGQGKSVAAQCTTWPYWDFVRWKVTFKEGLPGGRVGCPVTSGLIHKYSSPWSVLGQDTESGDYAIPRDRIALWMCVCVFVRVWEREWGDVTCSVKHSQWLRRQECTPEMEVHLPFQAISIWIKLWAYEINTSFTSQCTDLHWYLYKQMIRPLAVKAIRLQSQVSAFLFSFIL